MTVLADGIKFTLITMSAKEHRKIYGEGSEPGLVMPNPREQALFCQPVEEYRGMWHGQTELPGSPYVWKYSGGLATYPYQTRPMAVYAPEVRRTFFCYGGTSSGNHLRMDRRWDFQPENLLQMVSYYDHDEKQFPRPVCVFDKWCADPHDNPALQIDPKGYLWLFSPSHGEWTTRSFIHRSCRPYEISQWETIADGPLFAYPQSWIRAVDGWCMIHVLYEENRRGLFVKHSVDGRTWSNSRELANMGVGHYAVSWADPATGKIAVAFDYHPEQGGLEARTNLYYMESLDWGHSWQTIDGKNLILPQTDPHGLPLVIDLQAKGRLNYLRDIRLDGNGYPAIVFVSSQGWEPGPHSGPHQWNCVRWNGCDWDIHSAMRCDNNYDHGELDMGSDGRWSIMAPTEPGPQSGNPGGEIALWVSIDKGATWTKEKDITSASKYNHTFVRRPVNAHPDFAAFWADGDPRNPSESSLWFCNATGQNVQKIVA